MSGVLALATLAIVNTGLAYWLLYLLIDELGAATASVIIYVIPVVALLWSRSWAAYAAGSEM